VPIIVVAYCALNVSASAVMASYIAVRGAALLPIDSLGGVGGGCFRSCSKRIERACWERVS
jgi:hypothetical protein